MVNFLDMVNLLELHLIFFQHTRLHYMLRSLELLLHNITFQETLFQTLIVVLEYHQSLKDIKVPENENSSQKMEIVPESEPRAFSFRAKCVSRCSAKERESWNRSLCEKKIDGLYF